MDGILNSSHIQEYMFHTRKKQRPPVKSTMGKRSYSAKKKNKKQVPWGKARDQTFRLTKCLKQRCTSSFRRLIDLARNSASDNLHNKMKKYRVDFNRKLSFLCHSEIANLNDARQSVICNYREKCTRIEERSLMTIALNCTKNVQSFSCTT